MNLWDIAGVTQKTAYCTATRHVQSETNVNKTRLHLTSSLVRQFRCSHNLSQTSYKHSRRLNFAINQAATTDTLPVEQSGNAFTALKDIEEIQKILPHRFPFLLLDRVVELEVQKYAVGYKNITANDNFFTGHFPDRKIMPGVLQVEAMAQLGGIVMMDPDRDMSEQQNFFFGGIDSCKFRKPVVPGDTLMMKVELTKFNKRFGIAKVSGKAYVGPALVCEAELTLVLAK